MNSPVKLVEEPDPVSKQAKNVRESSFSPNLDFNPTCGQSMAKFPCLLTSFDRLHSAEMLQI